MFIIPDADMLLPTEKARLRSHKIRRYAQAQQEIEGKPLLGNPHLEGSSSSAHRGFDRLPRNSCTHTPGNGILSVGRLILLY